MIRLMLVDDDPIIRDSMGELLGEAEDLELVETCTNGRQALERLEEIGPDAVDVVILDVDMPILDGISTAIELSRTHPELKSVMLTAFAREDFLSRALEAGTRGYLTKDMPAEDLAHAIAQVHAGEVVMAPRPTEFLVDAYRSRSRTQEAQADFIHRVNQLPDHLRRVLDLIAEARTNSDIAEELDLKESTIRMYVSDVLRRTSCASRTEVAIRMHRAALAE